MPEEGVAAHFTVGNDIEAGGFLQRHGFVDRAILDPLEPDGSIATLEPSPPFADRPAGAGCQ